MSFEKLIVISGPSGCGKTTIAREVLKRHPALHFSVSATTRPKRAHEIDGIDYHFITKSAFEQKIRNKELAEWERIYDEYYGTPLAEIEKAFSAGRSILLDVDVKGALSIKSQYGKKCLLIFIKPPSLEALEKRLRSRETEKPDSLRKRLERVSMELELAGEFDHAIINDELSRAVEEVEGLITSALGVGA